MLVHLSGAGFSLQHRALRVSKARPGPTVTGDGGGGGHRSGQPPTGVLEPDGEEGAPGVPGHQKRQCWHLGV